MKLQVAIVRRPACSLAQKDPRETRLPYTDDNCKQTSSPAMNIVDVHRQDSHIQCSSSHQISSSNLPIQRFTLVLRTTFAKKGRQKTNESIAVSLHVNFV